MSRTSDIRFSFDAPVSVSTVVASFRSAGWSLGEPVDILYMVNIDDGYEWERGDISKAEEILELLDSPDHRDLEVGICIYHEAEATGGQLLFHSGRMECWFSPTIDRRGIADAEIFTDVSWYLQQLIPTLLSIGLNGYEARDLPY